MFFNNLGDLRFFELCQGLQSLRFIFSLATYGMSNDCKCSITSQFHFAPFKIWNGKVNERDSFIVRRFVSINTISMSELLNLQSSSDSLATKLLQMGMTSIGLAVLHSFPIWL
jgi:hypothetical protein